VSADEPEKPSAKLRRARYYRNIGKEVLFEGGMLLGAGFISELYVHMGFHPAWKFECVHELIFENGILMEAYDRSETIAAYRERMKGLPLDPGITDERVIKDWIDECFSLDYPSWLP
jgi:hypothetical protein